MSAVAAGPCDVTGKAAAGSGLPGLNAASRRRAERLSELAAGEAAAGCENTVLGSDWAFDVGKTKKSKIVYRSEDVRGEKRPVL